MRFQRHPVAQLATSDPLATIPVDSALSGRLRATYSLLREQELRFAELFYEKLFSVAPTLRPMFKSEPHAQAAKLVAALDTIVQNLEAPSANAALLAGLGRRHAGYGATPEHYDLVIDLLVESMRELLGDDTSPAALAEWRMALRLVSDQMIAASERPSSG